MVPKIEACIRAVEGGVAQAHVIDGRAPHSLLLEVFTDEGIGTMVLPAEESRMTNPGPPGADSPRHRLAGPVCRARCCPSSACRSGCSSHGSGCYVVDVDGKRYLDLLAGHRGQHPRARPPRPRRGGGQAGRPAHPRVQLLRHRTAGRARRDPAAHRRSARGSAVFFANSGHRGDRGRRQADPPHRPHPDHRRGERVPRPLDRRPGADLEAGLPRAVRAAHARRRLRAVQRRGRSRAGRPAGGRRPGRDRPGTDPRRGRRPIPPTRHTCRRPASSPTKAGALLVLDEVQSGMGRTGDWFAFQQSGGQCRTRSPWPRAWPAGSRSGRC